MAKKQPQATREEYAEKCIQFEENVKNIWSMEFDPKCLSTNTNCGLGDGIELGSTLKNSGQPSGDYTIWDACTDGSIKNFGEIPAHLGSLEKERKLVIPADFK